MTFSFACRVASLAALCAMTAAGAAQTREPANIFIGGVQYSPDSSYSYAGLLQPVAGGRIGEGWYRKVIASWLTYRYDTSLNGRDVEIRARSPGVEVGAGYGWQGKSYTFNLSGAVGLRDNRISPFAPDNEETGSIWTFNPQVQASIALTPRLEASTLASYAIGQETTYAKFRLAWKAGDNWIVGLQETYLKGENYRINQHGVVVGCSLGSGYMVDVSLGQSVPRGNDRTGYVQLGISRVY